MDLKGRAVLVTGAGRRVGQAIAIGLAQAGCDVGVHFHGSGDGAAETARGIRAAGRHAELLPADLQDAAAARGLADRAAGALGRLDILINSAAIMIRQPVAEITPESWEGGGGGGGGREGARSLTSRMWRPSSPGQPISPTA